LKRIITHVSREQRARRAIIRRPKAFLMDEPLSNLDARLRVDMRAELKHLQHELRIRPVYVTHDQAEAMTLPTASPFMQTGKSSIRHAGHVYHRPASTFVATFVGKPVDESDRSWRSHAGRSAPETSNSP